jgi:site-specific recombinase XerD
MPSQVSALNREHVESFVEYLLDRTSASTAATRYRGLQQFFRWLQEDGEITTNPMLNMRPPKFDDKEVAVVDADDIRKVLATCRGRTFEDRRDEAVLLLFLDLGLRLGELTHLTLDDIDLDSGEVRIRSEIAKRNRERTVQMGAGAERALDRYLRKREEHHKAQSTDRVWIGEKGALTDSGIVQLIRRRCKRAGLDYLIHPHALRHTAAHMYKARGMSDDNLMYLFGWKSAQMLMRYGRSAQGTRARNEVRKSSPAEDFS